MLRFAPLLILLALGCSMTNDGLQLPAGLEPLAERAAAAPKVGEQFPDITIVDAEGQPVNVRSLASEKPYTVLTLGCLT